MNDRGFTGIRDAATFIVGHPRSGTTMLLQLFDAHPQLLVFPFETHFFTKTWYAEKDKIGKFLEMTTLGKRLDSLGITKEEFTEKYAGFLADRRDRKSIFSALLQTYHSFYVRRREGEGLNLVRWVEKTPMHILFIPTFHRMFGDSIRIIYLFRDPRDVFASIKKASRHRYMIESFCATYYSVFCVARRLSRKHPNRILCLKYEDFVENPAKGYGKMASFLGIDGGQFKYTTSVMGSPAHAGSSFGDVRMSIDDKSVGRYAGYLTDGEINAIEKLLKKCFEEYDYRAMGASGTSKINYAVFHAVLAKNLMTYHLDVFFPSLFPGILPWLQRSRSLGGFRDAAFRPEQAV